MENDIKEACLHGGGRSRTMGGCGVLVHGGVSWLQRGRMYGVNSGILSLVLNMAL